MIIKFKPHDFEECLMGLPIENWQYVNEEEFLKPQTVFQHHRPKMMISHIRELQGIYLINSNIHIRAFTEFNDLQACSYLPEHFKNVLIKGQENALISYQTLGCYLNSSNFDRLIFPLFVACDVKIKTQSYIEERIIDFKKFAVSGRIQICNYNEISYEIFFPYKTYDSYVSHLLNYDMGGGVGFSYFMGIEKNKSIDMAIMLADKKVVRCILMEELIKKNAFRLSIELKQELLNIYYSYVSQLKIQLKYKQNAKKIFEDLIWLPLQELLME